MEDNNNLQCNKMMEVLAGLAVKPGGISSYQAGDKLPSVRVFSVKMELMGKK